LAETFGTRESDDMATSEDRPEEGSWRFEGAAVRATHRAVSDSLRASPRCHADTGCGTTSIELTMKTYSARPSDIKQDWYVVDGTNKVLGRLASQIASRLRGKHKPTFTPHMDTGDFIVVTNVDKIRVTGNKAQQKTYFRHSGYPGGIYETKFEKLHAKHPDRVLKHAVKGMLPKGPLGYAMLRKLKCYAGNEHPHAAQQPKALDL